MENKNRGFKIFLIIIAVIFVCVIIIKSLGLGNIHYGSEKGANISSIRGKYIAKLDVVGEIGGSDKDGFDFQWTMDTIDELMDDDDNEGILLYVDTPGGGVYESDEIYLKLKKYQDITKRPVFVYMGSMAASGGYYISSNADKIFANRNCWTGSIGVTIGTIYDLSGLLERYGVKTVTITSGPNKAMGSMVKPMSDEQRAIFQSLVDEAYDQFTQVVSEGRKIDIARVKQIADGRIYTAKQAKELGLVDEITDLESAENEILSSDRISPNCDIVQLEPERKTSLLDEILDFRTLIDGIKGKSSDLSSLSSIEKLMEKDQKFKVTYLANIEK